MMPRRCFALMLALSVSMTVPDAVAASGPRPAAASADEPALDEAPAYDEAPPFDESPAPPAEPSRERAPARPPSTSADLDFHPRTGAVTLGDGLARVYVPPGFGYLSPAETETLLAKKGGDRPGTGTTLGMLIRTGEPLDAPGSWGVTITYDEDGHVLDDGGDALDDDDLLARLMGATRGGGVIVGWARPPLYDARGKKLSWANVLRIEGAPTQLASYDVRILGRDGVLMLRTTAEMSILAEVDGDMRGLIAADFAEGHRYGEFDASTDRVAPYGLAELVAGGVTAKPGLFEGMRLLLLTGTRLVAAAVAALGVTAIAVAIVGSALLRRRNTTA